jgi:hypothetical protein
MERMTHLAEQGQRTVGVEAEVEIFRIGPRLSRELNLQELCPPFYLQCNDRLALENLDKKNLVFNLPVAFPFSSAGYGTAGVNRSGI